MSPPKGRAVRGQDSPAKRAAQILYAAKKTARINIPAGESRGNSPNRAASSLPSVQTYPGEAPPQHTAAVCSGLADDCKATVQESTHQATEQKITENDLMASKRLRRNVQTSMSLHDLPTEKADQPHCTASLIHRTGARAAVPCRRKGRVVLRILLGAPFSGRRQPAVRGPEPALDGAGPP